MKTIFGQQENPQPSKVSDALRNSPDRGFRHMRAPRTIRRGDDRTGKPALILDTDEVDRETHDTVATHN